MDLVLKCCLVPVILLVLSLLDAIAFWRSPSVRCSTGVRSTSTRLYSIQTYSWLWEWREWRNTREARQRTIAGAEQSSGNPRIVGVILTNHRRISPPSDYRADRKIAPSMWSRSAYFQTIWPHRLVGRPTGPQKDMQAGCNLQFSNCRQGNSLLIGL